MREMELHPDLEEEETNQGWVQGNLMLYPFTNRGIHGWVGGGYGVQPLRSVK